MLRNIDSFFRNNILKTKIIIDADNCFTFVDFINSLGKGITKNDLPLDYPHPLNKFKMIQKVSSDIILKTNFCRNYV